MQSKFPGKCACCGEAFPKGAEIEYLNKKAWLPGHYREPMMTEEERKAETARAEALGYKEEGPWQN